MSARPDQARDRCGARRRPRVAGPAAWSLKVRAGGPVRNKACYVAFGVNLEGERDVLGLSSQSSKGAKFRKTIKTRGRFPTRKPPAS
jgi:Transposase, Mutator family